MVVFQRFPSVSHPNEIWSQECKIACEIDMKTHIYVLPEYLIFIYVNKYGYSDVPARDVIFDRLKIFKAYI